MKLTADQVKHVAKLANLPLSDDEVKKFEEQLSETLTYIDKLNEINTDGVLPTSQVTGLENVTRDDEVTQSLPQDMALKNTKNTKNGFIVVKAILDNE